MKRKREFDEVMIVNPHDPGFGAKQGGKLMRFHYAQEPTDSMGYYAKPYGYYGQVPDEGWGYADPYGYYGQVPDEGWGYADPYGYYGQVPDEGWGYADPYGYYGQVPDEGWGYADPYGYYGQVPDESSGYANPYGYYGQVPDEGWGYADPSGYYAQEYMPPPPGGVSGYVRDVAPAFNAGCPIATNVAGLGDDVEGYIRPETVNAACPQFTSQPGGPRSEPETFRPLW
jgi:hypothetical protein